MSASPISIVTRGLKNTFRFGPGFGVIAKTALDNLVAINDAGRQAGEDGHDRPRGFAVRLRPCETAAMRSCPSTASRCWKRSRIRRRRAISTTSCCKIKAQNPDLVIPANYYNEYVLLARTMQQQHVRPKAIYSVLGGAASSYKFVKEFPEAAKYIMDCNHWFNPKNPKALELKKKIEAKGQFFTYEVYMNYEAVLLLADALERAASDRPRQDHRGAGELDLRRPLHALWPDQIRQRPEPGRGAGEHSGAGQRHQGDPAARVRQREAGVPDAAALTRCTVAVLVRRSRPVILVPAVLNGLMTGAVYALVALGLTLIYGVLHIINFAHGALLMRGAVRRVSSSTQLLGIDPYLAAFGARARRSSCSATRCSALSSARPRTATTATSCW